MPSSFANQRLSIEILPEFSAEPREKLDGANVTEPVICPGLAGPAPISERSGVFS
jgi:hypothetical protein